MNEVVSPTVLSQERVTGNGHIPRHDPLTAFREELNRQKERYKPFPIKEYVEGIYRGEFPHPPRNAADLVDKALTVRAPRRNQSGYLEYPVISERGDEFEMRGIPRSIEEHAGYFKTESRLNTKDNMVVLVAPTGAGKSTLNRVILMELEKYTDSKVPAPVYGIKGCPINEEPLHVLDKQTRDKWKEEKGIEINGELCPHCRLRAEDSVQKDSLGFKTSDSLPLDFEVQALRFSSALGRGITTLHPSVFMEPNANTLISKAILGSNRGILYIPELGQFSPDFLRSLNDALRGRRYSYGGQQYHLDNVIIADMTMEEWDILKKGKGNQSLLERIEEVTLTYALDPNAELQVIKKRIANSQLDAQLHFSPRALEIMAMGAVRTRLVPYPEETEGEKPRAGLSVGEKALFYSGKNVGGYTQSERRRVEEQGRKDNEGVHGMSPPVSWKIISKEINEQVSLHEDGGRGCVTSVGLLDRVCDFIIYNSTLSENEQNKWMEQFMELADENDEWILSTLEKAFQDRFPERANKALGDYLENAGFLLNPKETRIDPNTDKDYKPDEASVKLFEDMVNGGAFDSTTKGEEGRRKLRMNLQIWAGKIKMERGEEPVYTDFFDKIPGFEEGIKKYITRGLGDARDILRASPPTKEQSQKLVEMEGRLITEHGFCECCAPAIVAYGKSLLRPRSKS